MEEHDGTILVVYKHFQVYTNTSQLPQNTDLLVHMCGPLREKIIILSNIQLSAHQILHLAPVRPSAVLKMRHIISSTMCNKLIPHNMPFDALHIPKRYVQRRRW